MQEGCILCPWCCELHNEILCSVDQGLGLINMSVFGLLDDAGSVLAAQPGSGRGSGALC